MKRIIANRNSLLTIILLFLNGCAFYLPDLYKYDLSLASPASLHPPPYKQNGIASYSDNDIEISFGVMFDKLTVKMLNKTEEAIIINWDHVSYISPAGTSMRIIHSGVRFMERGSPQALTVVPPQSLLDDVLIPAGNIYYEYGQYGGWRRHELFGGENKDVYIGKEIGIYWPIEINKVKRAYNFRLRIDKATLLKTGY